MTTQATFSDRFARTGRFVVVGVVAGTPPANVGTRLKGAFQRSLPLATFSLDTVPATMRDAIRAEPFAAAARGQPHAVVHQVLPLELAAAAHRQLDPSTVFGRIVLTP
jgi:NADPH2:quinone reductase